MINIAELENTGTPLPRNRTFCKLYHFFLLLSGLEMVYNITELQTLHQKIVKQIREGSTL